MNDSNDSLRWATLARARSPIAVAGMAAATGLALLQPPRALAAEPEYVLEVPRLDIGDAPYEAYRQMLLRELRKRRLTLMVGEEGEAPSRVPPGRIRLGLKTLAACLLVLENSEGPIEVDLVSSIAPDGQLSLLSVSVGPTELVVETGSHPPLLAPRATASELATSYGVGPFVASGRSWTPEALAVVQGALEHLAPAEVALLARLPFHRRAAPRGDIAHILAARPYAALVTDPMEGARIEVYDLALEPQTTFVGTPDRAVHPAVHVLTHELAHALSFAARSRAMARIRELKEADDADNQRLEALRAEYPQGVEGDALVEVDALVERRTRHHAEHPVLVDAIEQGVDVVVSRWAEATGADSPTRYGDVSPSEGFAEAFALHRLDPQALERLCPKSSAWFRSHDVAALAAESLATLDARVAKALDAASSNDESTGTSAEQPPGE